MLMPSKGESMNSRSMDGVDVMYQKIHISLGLVVDNFLSFLTFK